MERCSPSFDSLSSFECFNSPWSVEDDEFQLLTQVTALHSNSQGASYSPLYDVLDRPSEIWNDLGFGFNENVHSEILVEESEDEVLNEIEIENDNIVSQNQNQNQEMESNNFDFDRDKNPETQIDNLSEEEEEEEEELELESEPPKIENNTMEILSPEKSSKIERRNHIIHKINQIQGAIDKKLTQKENKIEKEVIKMENDCNEESDSDPFEDSNPKVRKSSISIENSETKKVKQDHLSQYLSGNYSQKEVLQWSEAKISSWENRHSNPNAFYYRFTDPGTEQRNGAWSRQEHSLFMKQLENFKELGHEINTCWGIFSQCLSNRVGYQCSNYYRKLIKEGKVNDQAYSKVEGKLQMVDRGRKKRDAGGSLSDIWQTDEIKEFEKIIDTWLRKTAESKKEIDSTMKNDLKSELLPQKLNKEINKKKIGMDKTTKGKQKEVEREKEVIEKAVEIETKKKEEIDVKKEEEKENLMINSNLEKEDSKIEVKEEKESFTKEDDLESSEPKKPSQKMIQATIFQTFSKTKQIQDNNQSSPLITQKQAIKKKVQKDKKFKRSLNSSILLKAETISKIPQTVSNPLEEDDEDFVPLDHRSIKLQQLSLAKYFEGVNPVTLVEDFNTTIIKVPNPLPDSWAKKIHFDPSLKKHVTWKDEAVTSYFEVENLLFCNPESKLLSDLSKISFEGILFDPPWKAPNFNSSGVVEPCPHAFEICKFLKSFLTKSFFPSGMIFIWTPKYYFPQIFEATKEIGFDYVENLIWCKKQRNNQFLKLPSPFFQNSKEVLLMFRRFIKNDQLELRHQRNADVVFDFLKPKEFWNGSQEPKPEYCYQVIETLLPKSVFDLENGKGGFLEIWGPKECKRKGWSIVHESGSNQF